MNKYEPLLKYISSVSDFPLKLTFSEIGNILGFQLDHSFLNYKKQLEKCGCTVEKISLKEKYVIFNRQKNNI